MAESIAIRGPSVVITDPYEAKVIVRVLLDQRERALRDGLAWPKDLDGTIARLAAMTRNHAQPRPLGVPPADMAEALDVGRCVEVQWLSVTETSGVLGVSGARVRMIAEDLGGIKDRGAWRIPLPGIEKYAAQRRKRAA